MDYSVTEKVWMMRWIYGILILSITIKLSEQQCEQNTPVSYSNRLTTEQKLEKADIVLYGEDVTDREGCSRTSTCSAHTINFRVQCILKNSLDDLDIPAEITIGTQDAVNLNCGTIFPSNVQNEIYIVLVKYKADTNTYEWDEVLPRSPAALLASEEVINAARSTCEMSQWTPPVDTLTNSCPTRRVTSTFCANKCPKSWLRIEDRCLWIDQSEKKTLEEAKDTCENQGAQVISFQTEALWKAVKEQLPVDGPGLNQTFWTNGKCRKTQSRSLCFWEPQLNRDAAEFLEFKESPWNERLESSQADRFVFATSDGWRESTSNSDKRYTLCDKDAVSSTDVSFVAKGKWLGSYCCIDVKYRNTDIHFSISSVLATVAVQDVRKPPSFTLSPSIPSGSYFTILVILSPSYDVKQSISDVISQGLVINAVLEEGGELNTKQGNVWLSYKTPKVYTLEGMYYTMFIYQQNGPITVQSNDILPLVADNSCTKGKGYRCSFDITLFEATMSNYIILYDKKQLLLSFDDTSLHHAISSGEITSAEICKLKFPDIKTIKNSVVCPDASGAEGFAQPMRLLIIIFVFVAECAIL